MVWEHRRSVVAAAACVVAGATLGPPLANAGEEVLQEVIVGNGPERPVPIKGTITLADDTVTIVNEAVRPVPVTPTGDVPVRPGVAGYVQLQRESAVLGDGSVKLVFPTQGPFWVEQLNCFGSAAGLEHVTLQVDHRKDVHEMRFPATDGIVASGPVQLASDGDKLVVIARTRGRASNDVRCLLGGRQVR